MIFKGENILLRHPQESDSHALFIWENDPEVWKSGDNETNYSREQIEHFIMVGQDIHENGQERWMICSAENTPLGCIDLYEFSEKHQRAGIGILVYDKKFRNLGYGSEALKLIISYARESLNMKQLYCQIEEGNTASMKLFTNLGFEKTGVKKAWRHRNNAWVNDFFLQLILRDESDF